ncbi:MAG: hypothetical protein IKS60_08425 [Lachnospiraceae bacterium]|nr:hypothetical protein [Lachnospiraceae bacterium]
MSGKKKYTIEWAKEHSRDNGCYPDVFDKDAGLKDFHLNEHPDWFPVTGGYRPVLDENGNPVRDEHGRVLRRRGIKLTITSFRGVAFDAIHYYGKIHAEGIDIVDGEGYTHSGYLGDEFKSWPKEKQDLYGDYTIEIVRSVTQEEIDKDPERWKFYHPGNKTDAFETQQEIIDIAKKIVALRFPDGWEPLEIEKCRQ